MEFKSDSNFINKIDAQKKAIDSLNQIVLEDYQKSEQHRINLEKTIVHLNTKVKDLTVLKLTFGSEIELIKNECLKFKQEVERLNSQIIDFQEREIKNQEMLKDCLNENQNFEKTIFDSNQLFASSYKKLSSKHHDLTKKYNKQLRQLESATNSINHMRDQSSILEQNIQDLMRKLVDEETKTLELSKVLQDEKNKSENLLLSISAMDKKNIELSKTCEHLEELNEVGTQRLALQKESIEHLLLEKTDLANALADLQKSSTERIEDLSKNYQEIFSKLDYSQKQFKSTLLQHNVQYKKKRIATLNKLRSRLLDLKNLKMTCANLENELAVKDDSISILNIDLRKSIELGSSLGDTTKFLENQLDLKNNEIESLKIQFGAQIHSLQEAHATDLDKFKKSFSDLNSEISNLMKLNQAYTNQNQILTSQINYLQNDIKNNANIHENDLNSLKMIHQSEQSKIESKFLAELSHLQTTIEELKSTNLKLIENQSEKQSELSNAKFNLENSVLSLSEQLAKVSVEKEGFLLTIDKYEDVINCLNYEVDSLKQQQKTSMNQNSLINSNLQNEINVLNEKIQTLEVGSSNLKVEHEKSLKLVQTNNSKQNNQTHDLAQFVRLKLESLFKVVDQQANDIFVSTDRRAKLKDHSLKIKTQLEELDILLNPTEKCISNLEDFSIDDLL